MLTYAERFALVENGQWRNRLQMALWIACSRLLNTQGTSQPTKDWCKVQLNGPADATTIRRLAVITLADATIGSQGLSASDASVQSAVDAAVPNLQ